MLGFLWVSFVILVFENAFLVYKFFINKPIKQQLAEANAKLKTAETINEILNKELPDNKRDKLARFSELTE